MNVLSLDMSTQKSGYSLFNNSNLIENNLWQLLIEDENDWNKRILFMIDKVDKYIKHNNVDIVYYETPPPILSNNTQTLKILSALQGAITSVCFLNNIPIEFVSVRTWKTQIGIDLTHSAEFKQACKGIKDKKKLARFKNIVKHYEKKMSVDLVNHLFDLGLVYISPSSKKNSDDMADSVLIALSKIDNNIKYDLEAFSDIIDKILRKVGKD